MGGNRGPCRPPRFIFLDDGELENVSRGAQGEPRGETPLRDAIALVGYVPGSSQARVASGAGGPSPAGTVRDGIPPKALPLRRAVECGGRLRFCRGGWGHRGSSSTHVVGGSGILLDVLPRPPLPRS